MERPMITSDCHIAPPYSVVAKLPSSYQEHFAHLEPRDDGEYLVQPIPESMKALMGDMADMDFSVKVDENDRRALARHAVGNVCDEARPSFDPDELLEDLALDGVGAAVLIGRVTAFEAGVPPEIDAAFCEVVNDWQAETFGGHLDCFAPGIYLPYKDVGASVKELERAAAMGLRPALLPDGIWDQPYHLEEWEPLWEAANRLKVPITMHVGGLRNPPSKVAIYPGLAYVSWYNFCVGMGETLGWLTFGGVFERYPDLHVVVTEGYAGWLAFAMQFYDHHFSDSRFGNMDIGNSPASPKIDKPPSYYLKRQAHATFMWDPVAVRERDVTGLDCLLWGNDYPHQEGSFPFSQEWADKQFAGVPDEHVDAMVHGNAARLFGLTV